MSTGQTAEARIEDKPGHNRPQKFKAAASRPALHVVDADYMAQAQPDYTPENPYTDPTSEAGAMIRTDQPVIILTADKATSYGHMSKCVTETFPGVPIIFEDKAARQAFGRASWNHYARNVIIGTIGEGRLDSVLRKADRVITFGAQLKNSTYAKISDDITIGNAPMAVLALNQNYEDYAQAAARWRQWFQRTQKMTGRRNIIA